MKSIINPSMGRVISLNVFARAIAIGCILMSCGNSDKTVPAAEAQEIATPSVARLEIGRDSVITLTIPSDASQSYCIYIPNKAKSIESTPILICFDPHGDGRLPIDKYKEWADKFGIAIAGSNSSRNGLSGAEAQQIATNMIADITNRLGFDKRYSALCGFSGGSKVAIEAIGSDATIPNLIYAGAVTQLNNSRQLNVLGFAGREDMNYTDLLQFNESIKSTNPNSTLIEFDGKHEWPNARIFEKAFYWIFFKSGIQDSIALKKNIAEYMNTQIWSNTIKDKVGLLYEYEDYEIARNILKGVSDISIYERNMSILSKELAFKEAFAEKSKSLKKEANEKGTLQMAFQNQNYDWWTKVINGYKASSAPSEKRLLGFVSLAGFSYSNRMLQQHDLEGAERMLAIYELADPTNTDQLYFHAILYAEKNNPTLAVKYLQKAVSNGFNDIQKIESEQAFSVLRNDPNFSQIVAALKKASK